MSENDSLPYKKLQEPNNENNIFFVKNVGTHSYFGSDTLFLKDLRNGNEFVSEEEWIGSQEEYGLEFFDLETSINKDKEHLQNLFEKEVTDFTNQVLEKDNKNEFYYQNCDKYKIYHLFNEILDNKELCKKLDDSNLDFRSSDLKKPISDIDIKFKDVPDEVFLDILENHKNKHFSYFEKFKQFIKEDIPKVLDRLELANTIYALGFDMVLIDHILTKKTKYFLLDYLNAPNILGRNENLESGTNVVGITTDFYVKNHKVIDSTLIHEIIHSLSGRNYNTTFRDYVKVGGDVVKSVGPNKVGLAFKGNEYFNWLNEAVTTKLQILIGGTKNNSYSKNLELLDLLVDKGKKKIPMSVFYKAYFEPGNIMKSDKGEMYYWRELVRKINESFYNGILKDIDIVAKHSFDDAINALSSDNVEQNIKECINKIEFNKALDDLLKLLGSNI